MSEATWVRVRERIKGDIATHTDELKIAQEHRDVIALQSRILALEWVLEQAEEPETSDASAASERFYT